jgi:hypothetical protein
VLSAGRLNAARLSADYFSHLEFGPWSRYGQRRTVSSGHTSWEEGRLMGKKVSNVAIIFGCSLMVLGLCFLPAALGNHPDPAILGGGVCLFSLGALMASSGMYLKAVAAQAGAPAGVAAGAAKGPVKRARGGCDLCGTESPAVNCKVHQVHLCGDCLGKHYDFRSCVYVPSTRRPATVKVMARGAGKA